MSGLLIAREQGHEAGGLVVVEVFNHKSTLTDERAAIVLAKALHHFIALVGLKTQTVLTKPTTQ